MATEAGGRRCGTRFTFGGRETWGDAGRPAIGLAIVVRLFTILSITVLPVILLPIILLPIIVLLNGERGGQQALEGLLVQHQSGPGRRHVFGRGGKFWLTLL